MMIALSILFYTQKGNFIPYVLVLDIHALDGEVFNGRSELFREKVHKNTDKKRINYVWHFYSLPEFDDHLDFTSSFEDVYRII